MDNGDGDDDGDGDGDGSWIMDQVWLNEANAGSRVSGAVIGADGLVRAGQLAG